MVLGLREGTSRGVFTWVLGVLGCACTLAAQAAPNAPRNWLDVAGHRYLWMEAESADVMLPSFVARRDQAVSGGIYLTIPEGAGTAAFDSGVGVASYTFTVPSDGMYDIWARVLWESGCSNSFAVTLDDEKLDNRYYKTKAVSSAIGKDTTLSTWHWVRHIRVPLTAGEHVFSLHNQDDGSSIDSLVITDDTDFQPEGVEPWFYGSTFAGGQADGWTLMGGWQAVTDGDTAALRKEGTAAGRVTLKGYTAATVYWSGQVQAVDSFELMLGDAETSSTRVTWANGALTIQATDGEPATTDQPTLAGHLEVWRTGNRVDVALDGQRVLTTTATPMRPGPIAFDGGAGTIVDDVVTVPLLPLHAGANYYSQWNDWLVEDTTGEWICNQGIQALQLQTPTGTAFIGRPWWQDYQLAFLFNIPDNGTLDIGVCARSPQDAHVLSISHDPLTLDFQQLVRTRDGTSTPLAKPLNVALKNDFNLAVINIINGRIQVYINGEKLFDVNDNSLAGGRIFFRGNGAQKLQIDDIEAWSLDRMPDEGTWPALRVHESMPVRRLHSVLDSRGAVGGIHPGFHAPSRDEPELRWLMANHQAGTPPERARIIDYQWSTFGNAYEDRYGDGEKQGWILARSISPETEHVLWSTLNAHSDWRFSWRSFGTADNMGAILYPWPLPPGDTPPSPLRIWVSPRENTLNVARGDAEPTVVKLAGHWSESVWYDWELESVNGMLDVKLGGVSLHQQSIAELGGMIRPALYFRHGRLYIDDLELTLFPDVSYRFDFNYPYHLTLAGWDTNGIGAKPRFSGGYYCRMDLQHPAGHTYLRSRRAFRGDTTLELVMTRSSSESLSLSLLDVATGAPALVLRLTGEHVDAWHGEERLGYGALRPHAAGTSDMDTVRFRVQDGFIDVFVDDQAGSDRLALRVKLPAGTTDLPYYLQLDAAPRLVVKKILIWNPR